MSKKTVQNQITPRPPVIAVMGHIDHGKSTLLDYIRQTNTTAKEAGGITQHIAAYEVEHKAKDGVVKKITFLDTPGHEAFIKIRQRGADVADIAILVVSAEEGVKPQTLEALKCIKDSKTPYIVAINKIDSPKADLERTKQSLAEHEIYVEGYGGDISWAAVSGKTGEGIPELLDLVLLVAELEELSAESLAPAEGVVIDANLDNKKGTSATLIIKNGTLKKGDFVSAGEAVSPVRSIEDWSGKRLEEATFSSPVRLIGFDIVPQVGQRFKSFATRKEAEAAALASRDSAKKIALPKNGSLTALPEGVVFIPVVIKADVAGTLEAIFHEIKKIETDKVKIKVLYSGIGTISESDAKKAMAEEKTVILGFGTKIDAQAKSAAERTGTVIHVFSIIYKLIEWLQNEIKEKTPIVTSEESTGRAKILKIFSKTKDKQIVGGRVEIGTIEIGAEVKLLRREAVIGSGRIRELQQKKEKTKIAAKDSEFGAMIESKIEIAEGDRIECFKLVTK